MKYLNIEIRDEYGYYYKDSSGSWITNAFKYEFEADDRFIEMRVDKYIENFKAIVKVGSIIEAKVYVKNNVADSLIEIFDKQVKVD